MLEAGWVKVFHPRRRRAPRARLRARRVHAALLRRVPRPARGERPRGAARRRAGRRARCARTLAGCASRAGPRAARARWLARSAAHHGGRRVASALGSRAERLPGARAARAVARAARRHRSRSRAGSAARAHRELRPAAPPTRRCCASTARARPRSTIPCRAWPTGPLHVAVVIPPFQRGSGGHNTIFTLLARLEEMGHTCSIWLYDPRRRHHEAASVLRRRIVEEFAPLRAPVHKGFDDWYGRRRRRSPPAGTPSTPPCCCPAAAPAPTSSRTTSPSSSPPRPSRSGPRAPTSSACTGSRRAAGCATCSRERYGQPAAGSASGSTTASTARGRWSDAATPSSSTPASSPRDVPCRSGRSRSTELHRRRPQTRFVLFGQAEELRPPVRVRAARRDRARGARVALLGGDRGALPVAHQLLPDPAGDDGLRAPVRGPGRRQHRGRARARRRRRARRGRPGGDRRRARSAARDDEDAGGGAPRPGSAFVETASWDVAAKQVEAGLREALRERERAAAVRTT